MTRKTLLASAAMMTFAWATGAQAQQQSEPEPTQETAELGEIVVTARAGTQALKRVEAAYAITTVNEERLRMQNPLSVSDALKFVPGFWVESSGGEASANIRARGIPQEGFSAVAMQEDGLPIQHDAGLGFMNADQSFRIDETIERLEVVRGGPSVIFGSYAPGGIVNFITKKGGDAFEGLVKAQVGDYGLYRADVWLGGPVGGGWTGTLGGFYRVSDGIRDPGFTADEGGQIRATLSNTFERGSVDLGLSHMDDNAIFFAGIPLTFDEDGDVAGVPGFDPNFGTVVGPETQSPAVRGVDGRFFQVPVDGGTDAVVTRATARFRYDLGADWEFLNNVRFRTSEITRSGFFPASPLTATARLAAISPALLAATPGGIAVQLRYVTSPTQIFDIANQNGNGLVLDSGVRAVTVQYDEILSDSRLQRRFDFGGQSHDVALGFYAALVDETFTRYSNNALSDVQDNARLLDVVVVNAAGQALYTATENGFTRYGSEFANAGGSSETFALYASDEWKLNDQWRIDVGARWETISFTGYNERSATRNLGVTPSTADDTFLTGTGVFDQLDRQFDDWAWTAGINWQFRPDMGVFARYTDAFRLPSLGDFITSPTRSDARIQGIKLGEAGYKLSTPTFDLYATAFYTAFDAFGFGELVLNPVTGVFTSRTAFTDTETIGLELDGEWRPTDWFDMRFNATFQQPEFQEFVFTELVSGAPVTRDFSGNRLLRVPEESYRLIPAVNLMNDALRLELDVQYYGDRFTDAANSTTLPAYTILNANIRYDLSERIALYLNGTNLTNEIGLTEGNPRAGQFESGDAGARFYTGRPELGRAVRASILYRF